MSYDYIGKEYFLSSLESSVFVDIRRCTFIRQIDFNYDGSAVWVEITPAIVIGDLNDVTNNKEYSELLLLTRFEVGTFTNISTFPCFVHIAILNNDIKIIDVMNDKIVLSKTDITTLAWGEIYNNLDDKLLVGKQLLPKI